MQVGVVKEAEDADFFKLITLSESSEGWNQVYNKHGMKVWTKSNDQSRFDMIKIYSTCDVAGCTLYDVLLDPEYRKLWDRNMVESYDICCLNPNNDIGYYCMKCPTPLKNRDFVTQRSFLATVKEFLVINHSVNHEKAPPKKGIIRGISYLTGYLIRPTGKTSCEIYYVTQSDPKGHLPSWLVNKLTTIVAPKQGRAIMQRLCKAARGYESWKKKHNPHHKPWLDPEQIDLPPIDWSDIKPLTTSSSCDSLEEDVLELKEEEFTSEELDRELNLDL